MEDRRACATKHYSSACQGPRRHREGVRVWGWGLGAGCRLHVLEAGWQERHGGVPGSERGWRMGWKRERKRGEAGGQVSVFAAQYLYKQRACVDVLFIRTGPCARKCACVCVHERADVYSFLRSNAHSQMKSSNVSARKPQLGSHGSWSCKPQWSCLNEAGQQAPSLAGEDGGGESRVVEGMVTSREPLPKSGLLSPAKEAPCWHAVSAEKLESSAARSAAVKIMRAKRTNKLWWAEKPATLCHPPPAQNRNKWLKISCQQDDDMAEKLLRSHS